jgi:hypothetical protein
MPARSHKRWLGSASGAPDRRRYAFGISSFDQSIDHLMRICILHLIGLYLIRILIASVRSGFNSCVCACRESLPRTIPQRNSLKHYLKCCYLVASCKSPPRRPRTHSIMLVLIIYLSFQVSWAQKYARKKDFKRDHKRKVVQPRTALSATTSESTASFIYEWVASRTNKAKDQKDAVFQLSKLLMIPIQAVREIGKGQYR